METLRRRKSKMEGQKGRGRGFASMSPEKKREIASKGGKAAHALGTAHKWTSEEAQAAGRKGGSISRRRSKYSVQTGIQA
jgi:general stress protein YciG